MILAALLLLLQSVTIYDDPGDAPPVPDAAQHAYGAYLKCFIDGPLDPFGGSAPTEPATRKALLQQALADCHDQRVATVAEMDAKFPRTGAFADPVKRHARVEEIVGKSEQRLAFSYVNADEFRAIVTDLSRCWKAGGGDTCKPSRPMK